MKFQLLIAGCVLFTGVAAARTSAAQTTAHVVQEVVLIRHGIRSPTKAPEALGVHSQQVWPSWPVAPGMLTDHGGSLMRALGEWHRNDALAAGLDVQACNAVRVIADSAPRTRDSAVAMVRGLTPDCEAMYHALPVNQRDPLFTGVSKSDDDNTAVVVSDAQVPHEAAAELQRVLLGCDADACLAQAREAGKKPVLSDDPGRTLAGAGSLAENIMLEYAQGFPADRVGWGRADASAVARLITLHNAEFAALKQPHEVAEKRDGNMVAHVAATFAHAAGVKTELPSLAADGEHMVVLVGHDTDLATSASLLGVSWHDASDADDYPPGGALVYQLLRTTTGEYAVRLRVALPTLAGLRAARTSDGGIRVATVRQPACGNAELCPLPKFLRHVREVVGSGAIDPHAGGEPGNPVPVLEAPAQ